MALVVSLISSKDFPVREKYSLFEPNNSLLPFLGNFKWKSLNSHADSAVKFIESLNNREIPR
jgi:hypothetical protein